MPQVASTSMCSSAAKDSSEPGLLFLGEQIGAGVRGPAHLVEGVICSSAMTVQVLLAPSAATVQRVCGKAPDVEQAHHHCGPGKLFGGGSLEAGEAHPSRRPPALRTRTWGAPAKEYLNAFFGAAFDHVERAGGPASVRNRGQIDDRGNALVTATRMAPDLSSTPTTATPSNRPVSSTTTWRPSIKAASFAARQTTARASTTRAADVLTPHPPAAYATVAAHPHQQRRGPSNERLVHQVPAYRPQQRPLSTTATTERVVASDDVALEYGPHLATSRRRTHPVARRSPDQERRRQSRARRGLPMGSVRASVIGGPRPVTYQRNQPALHPQIRFSLQCRSQSEDTAPASASSGQVAIAHRTAASLKSIPETNTEGQWPQSHETAHPRCPEESHPHDGYALICDEPPIAAPSPQTTSCPRATTWGR